MSLSVVLHRLFTIEWRIGAPEASVVLAALFANLVKPIRSVCILSSLASKPSIRPSILLSLSLVASLSPEVGDDCIEGDAGFSDGSRDSILERRDPRVLNWPELYTVRNTILISR